MYIVNGGEFKKENKGGYIMGIGSLICGIGLIIGALFLFLSQTRILTASILVLAGGFLVFKGFQVFTAALKGKYRDEMDPFNAV